MTSFNLQAVTQGVIFVNGIKALYKLDKLNSRVLACPLGLTKICVKNKRKLYGTQTFHKANMEDMMSVVHMTDDDFDTAVKSGKKVVVDFWAPWCGPCKMIAPIFEELSGTMGDKVTFGKINVDEQQRAASANGVTSIPSLIFFDGGKRVDTLIGAVPKQMLEAKIKQVFNI